LGTVSISRPFSEQNTHSVGHWWKLDRLETPSRKKLCVYSTPCDGRCYIDKTSRPLEVRIKEHKYNLTQGLLQKSKLAQHAYEEGHTICWDEGKVLQIERNTTYRDTYNPPTCLW
jgi:hypothetical protein